MTTKWLVVAAFLIVSGAAFAQQTPPPPPGGPGGPGMAPPHHDMRGGWGMMGGRAMPEGGMMMGGPFCENSESMAPRMLGHLESTIRPTEAQKPEMDALRAAAGKAEAIVRAACPAAGEDDRSPPARLAQMEKHVTAMADALKTIRPAFDALYAKLDDRQRDRLRWSRGPRP